jgi:hypothetical protein
VVLVSPAAPSSECPIHSSCSWGRTLSTPQAESPVTAPAYPLLTGPCFLVRGAPLAPRQNLPGCARADVPVTGKSTPGTLSVEERPCGATGRIPRDRAVARALLAAVCSLESAAASGSSWCSAARSHALHEAQYSLSRSLLLSLRSTSGPDSSMSLLAYSNPISLDPCCPAAETEP